MAHVELAISKGASALGMSMSLPTFSLGACLFRRSRRVHRAPRCDGAFRYGPDGGVRLATRRSALEAKGILVQLDVASVGLHDLDHIRRVAVLPGVPFEIERHADDCPR